MEELLEHPLLTLTLAPNFHSQQWQQLSRQPPTLYQLDMLNLARLLDQCLPQHTTQYYRFIQNHLTIALWHKHQPLYRQLISPYLFNPALAGSPLCLNKTKEIKQICRTQPNAVRNFFAEEVGVTQVSSHWRDRSVDSHGLYMQTLKACKGHKYRAYNYQKHMKSSLQRKQYNGYIRPGHKKNSSTPQLKQHPLEQFDQFKRQPLQKTSLVNVRGVLLDLNLNNQKGLRQLLKKQGTQKLVLVNHQRKPVNYYLSQRSHRTKHVP